MTEQTGKQADRKGAYLVIHSQIFPLKKEIVRIGRKLDNDLVIQEPMVSRYHAEVRFEDGEFFVYDIGSRFGTFLNSEKVERAPVKNGDTISLANSPVLFIDRSDKIIRQIEQTTGALILRDTD